MSIETPRTSLRYLTGEDILDADRISYHGDPGEVEFVLTSRTGNALRDWYLQRFPEGGLMIHTPHFGRLFVSAGAIDHDLALVSRSPDKPESARKPLT